MYDDLMRGVSVLHLRFTVRTHDPITFGLQPGTALRGALYEALSDHFCSEREGKQTPDHQERCPVCWLLAAEEPDRVRGGNPPRALMIQPPPLTDFSRGATFSFGVSLVGSAQSTLPYLLLAVPSMGKNGLGKGRGRFTLQRVEEFSPLWDTTRLLMDGNRVTDPTLQVTSVRVQEWAEKLLPNRVTIRFETPTRLIRGGILIPKPDPQVFVQRLLERCQHLAEQFAETDHPPTHEDWREAWQALSAIASNWTVAFDETEWVDVWSGSRRTGRVTPVGGIRGTVRWEGEIAPLHTWLLWGQSLHVGKDSVKGNGWYKVVG